MEKRTLEQAKELVNSSFPTIFSKEDVMNLLGSIEIPEPKDETPKGKFFLTDEQIESLSERISSDIEDDISDLLDTDDADFDIDVDYDRRIHITIDGGIGIDTSEVERITAKAITLFISSLNEEAEDED